MAMLIFYALTYTKIYCCLTRHLNVDTTLVPWCLQGLAPFWNRLKCQNKVNASKTEKEKLFGL